MHVTAATTPNAQRAELTYRVLGEVCPNDASLVEVRLLTGRKHQIRVQLSDIGFPIWGDRKYGSRRSFPAGIALHSRRLSIVHPVSKMQLEFEAPLPACWRGFVEIR
jgi:23S rRNA pseudouridine1911/1915/1917 synthase